MKSYEYVKIDAFTSKGSLGNPAACLYLQDNQTLEAKEMLTIAKEHSGFVSEVIYCMTQNNQMYLTYYSSECEVDFCGHGTIACMYYVIKNTPSLLEQEVLSITTHKKGELQVYNRLHELDAVFISAPKPVYLQTSIIKETLATNLNINMQDIDSTLPIELIDAGLRTLIVPIKDLETEITITPDERVLKAFCVENRIDIILIFSLETSVPDKIAHTRVFAPKFGYLEDPATGSGNSAFGYYMRKNDLWTSMNCDIEQGKKESIYNSIKLLLDNETILFGGSATTKIQGKYNS